MVKKILAKKSKLDKNLPSKLINYLDGKKAKFNLLKHKTVYTAYDAASTMRKKLSEVAKTLLVTAEKNYYLVILPADYNLDTKKLAQFISQQTGKKIKIVKIPPEKVMTKVLKIKAGALSAFGGLHKLPVILDKKLIQAKKAVFSSGSFNHSVEMAVKDFVKLENALLGNFGIRKKLVLAKKK